MEIKLKCPNCSSSTIIKNGFTRSRGQRYKCKNCRSTFDVGTLDLQKRRFRILRSSLRAVLKDLLLGLTLAAILISAKIAFEHHYGHGMLLATYDFLQTRLVGASKSVAVIDISNLDIKPVAHDRVLTDRRRLLDLVNTLARQEPPPRAIGIDIDFSTDRGIMRRERNLHDPANDGALFDRCLELKQGGIPVVLGVFISRKLEPKDWLGGGQYAELAGNMQAFSYHNRESVYMTKYERRSAPILSFGGQLAKESGLEPSRDSSVWERLGLIELFSNHEIDEFLADGTIEKSRIVSHLIDYSAIENIEAEQIVGVTPEGEIDVPNLKQNWEKIGGKIVILGASGQDSNADPSFPVAGFWRRSYKGAFLHASSIYTLVESPLYSLTHRGQIWIDAILSLLVLLLVAAGRIWNLRSIPKRRISEESAKFVLEETKLPLRITICAILFSIAFGVLFINLTRIVWIDFVLVIIALLLHQLLERYLHAAAHFIRRILGMRNLTVFGK